MQRIFFCLLTIFILPVCAFAQAKRPNVLLILLDDLGYSDLGCYGGEIPTPHIDALAQSSLRFTQVYNSARCCPSRASLLTGLYPHQTGVGAMEGNHPKAPRGYVGHLNNECVTLGQVLKGAGYRTYAVGKWHVGTGAAGPVERGFDHFYGFPSDYAKGQWDPKSYVRLPAGQRPELTYPKEKFYATDALSDYALAFIQDADAQKDAPWFLYLAYGAPHFPLQAPADRMKKFVPTYLRGWDALREERFDRMKKIGLADRSWTLTDSSLVPEDGPKIANGYAGKPNPKWDTLPKDRQNDLAHRMALFAAMVTKIDDGVGRVVDYLKSNGEFENTVIILLSDNGACYEWGPFGFDEASRKGVTILHKGAELDKMGGPGTYHSYGSGWANLGNTPFRMYKHFTNEGGICTPMVVSWPRGISRKPGWVKDVAHVIDIMPTLCDITGASYPAELGGVKIQPEEGKSLRPIFAGDTLPDRLLGWEHEGARAMRLGPWKAVYGKRGSGNGWELYNLEQDRSETIDVAADHPDILKKLSDAWNDWAQRVFVTNPDKS